MTFQFAHPAAFLLFMLPVMMFWLRSRKKLPLEIPALLYSSSQVLKTVPYSWRLRWRHLPDFLWLCAWVLLVVSLARPQSGQVQQIIRGEGVDIVLALDISGSMEAPDFAPLNRLEAAKNVIASFVAGRSFDRIGLVVFAADAFQRVPLTLDYNLLLRSLESIELAPALGLPDGTAIGLGIASSGNLLRPGRSPSRIIILLTDGANNAGSIGPLTAAQAVAALGMRVYTIAMGGDLQENNNLDEDTLREIALLTNALFFRAKELSDLQAIYSEINSLERSEVERVTRVEWDELAPSLLALALLFLTTGKLLRMTALQVLP